MLRGGPISFAIFGALFASCLDPTEIVLVISTDVACNDVAQNGIAVAIGAPNDDTTVAGASTRDCSSDGGIGTLTVLPHGISDAVGIRVMLGVDASVEDCDVAHKFAGCIVARRTLRFDPHRPLKLPIELQASCLGQECTPDSTCFNGSCVDASVGCTGSSCDLPDTGPPPPPPPSCVPIPPKVIEASAVAYTPRIAKIPKGYVITWVAPAGGANWLTTATLDANGTPSQPIQLFKLSGPLATPGPIGSDGSTFVTFMDDTSSATPLVTITSPLGGAPSIHLTTGRAPLDGVWPTATAIYESLFDLNGIPGIYNVSPFTTSQGISFTNLDLTATYDFGLARAGSTTFLSFGRKSDQACHVDVCASTACSEVYSFTCSDIRLAAMSSTSWAAVVSGPTLMFTTWANNVVNSVGINATLANLSAILPLATSSGPFAFVRDASESLLRFTMPPTTPLVVDTVLDFESKAGGTGAGFDGVADDNTSSAGQALVYFKSDGSGTGVGVTPGTGAIYFTHLCQ